MTSCDDRADAIGRDDSAREDVAVSASALVARRRVVEAEVRVDRQHLAEVALPHPGGGHGQRGDTAALLLVTLPAAEVEQAVLLDGTADGAAEDVGLAIRVVGRREVVLARVELVLVAEPERRPANLVGARLGGHRDRRAARHALRRIEAVGRDVDRLDRLGRRDVAGVVGQPHVDGGRTVDTRDVVVAVGAVDVGRQRAARGVGLRVLEGRRRGTGHQVHQRLVVPVLVQRQVDDLGRLEVHRDVGLVGLEQGRLGGHGDRLGQRADLESRRDTGHVVLRDREAGLDVLLEALQGGPHRVGTGLQVAERERARLVGHAHDLEAVGLVDHRDRRARNGRAGVVDHRTGNRAVQGLRHDGGREQGYHRGQHECQASGEKSSNRLHSHLRRLSGCGDRQH